VGFKGLMKYPEKYLAMLYSKLLSNVLVIFSK
jgi:hypothetical protein